MKRLMEKTVFWGFVTACRLATWPTSRSPSRVKPTTDGVVRPPSAFGITTGSPPSMTATTEFVVPRSIPMTLSAIASSVESVGRADLESARRFGGEEGKRETGFFRQLGRKAGGARVGTDRLGVLGSLPGRSA